MGCISFHWTWPKNRKQAILACTMNVIAYSCILLSAQSQFLTPTAGQYKLTFCDLVFWQNQVSEVRNVPLYLPTIHECHYWPAAFWFINLIKVTGRMRDEWRCHFTYMTGYFVKELSPSHLENTMVGRSSTCQISNCLNYHILSPNWKMSLRAFQILFIYQNILSS
jgi:hypothetical protein